MRYLLDTNVISELRKAGTPRAHPGVIHWAKGIDADDMYISVITIMEIERGILSCERRDPGQARVLRSWFEQKVMVEFAWRTLSIDTRIAHNCAWLHVPARRPESDALIAATALQHDLTLVSRNTKDYQGMGVILLNPWESPPG